MPRVLCLFALLISVALPARAERPFITLRDDSTVETLPFSGSQANRVIDAILRFYDASGAPVPEILSVWTAFNFNSNHVETRYIPMSNDITGIGLEDVYGDPPVFSSEKPPMRAMLIHNNVLRLEDRAALVGAPSDGYGRYLFLLELSHLFGPQARVAGDDPGALIGFPFHWSFWMDAGGSPAGGNAWRDNGDGTFTTEPMHPGTLRFHWLDLYLMGMATPSEVPDFGVLENVTPPAGVQDPFTRGPLSAASFPWFKEQPVTVTATRRMITIGDVISATGTRSPAHEHAPRSFTLGIVLLVPLAATDEEVAAAERAFEPVARSLAPGFNDATHGRGTLDVVTSTPEPDAGVPTVDAGVDVHDAGGSNASEPQGCRCTAPPTRAPWALLGLATLIWRRRSALG